MSELVGRVSGTAMLTGKFAAAGGTTDHRLLENRDAEGQHPIKAITGLQGEIARIPPPTEKITNSEIEEMLK